MNTVLPFPGNSRKIKKLSAAALAKFTEGMDVTLFIRIIPSAARFLSRDCFSKRLMEACPWTVQHY